MGWMVWGLNPGKGKKFSLLQNAQTGSGAQPSYYTEGTEFFFTKVKQPRCEVDHSPPSSAEVKNGWSCTSTPPICLHGVEKEGFYPSFSDNDL